MNISASHEELKRGRRQFLATGADEEMADFLMAEKLGSHLRFREVAGRGLVVTFDRMPAWAVVLAMLVPMAAATYLTIWREQLDRIAAIAVLCMMPIVCAMIAGLFWLVNRRLGDCGELLVLDREGKRLLLPRFDAALDAAEVVKVVRLRGWKLHAGEYEELFELGVVARERGALVRFALAAGPKQDVDRLAEALATALDRPICDIGVGNRAA